ncbi:MAG: hypothetical protein JWO80_3433 [Bryobacterales bacterium]|nr:hypothetical protein [Bryobacterales bacterium]
MVSPQSSGVRLPKPDSPKGELDGFLTCRRSCVDRMTFSTPVGGAWRVYFCMETKSMQKLRNVVLAATVLVVPALACAQTSSSVERRRLSAEHVTFL